MNLNNYGIRLIVSGGEGRRGCLGGGWVGGWFVVAYKGVQELWG